MYKMMNNCFPTYDFPSIVIINAAAAAAANANRYLKPSIVYIAKKKEENLH